MGARFAGGRPGYLLALSSPALKQDGRSRAWPARAFLPARGTLIGEIAMLRDEAGMADNGRAGLGAIRPTMALVPIGLTLGVATLKVPTRATDFTAVAQRFAKLQFLALKPMVGGTSGRLDVPRLGCRRRVPRTDDPMVRDVPLQEQADVIADRDIPPVGLDDDPFEQVVGDVDRPALDPPGRLGGRGPARLAGRGASPALGRGFGVGPVDLGRLGPRLRTPLQDAA